VFGLDAGLIEELPERHRGSYNNAAQQQVEDAGDVRQLQRAGRFLLKPKVT